MSFHQQAACHAWLEAATYRDVPVRVLCGNMHPDHDTICTFRRKNKEAFENSFIQVLQLSQEMKLLRIGRAIALRSARVNAKSRRCRQRAA